MLSPNLRPLSFLRLLQPVILIAVAASAQAKITLTGVNGELKQSLVKAMDDLELPCDASPAKRNGVQKSAEDQLHQTLQALSYFNAELRSELVQADDCWRLRINVAPGPRLVIRNSTITLEGEATADPLFEKYIREAQLQAGALFDSARYEQLKEQILAQGLRQGFFDNAFREQRVDIYPDANAADITLIWDSGKRYRFGEISIDQAVLKPALFADLLTVKTGDYYSLDSVQDDRILLSETRYFGTVEVKPLPDQRHDGSVPVQIQASPGKVDSYQAGVGFSTNTGVRVRSDYTRHRVNRLGHKGEIGFLVSEVLSTLNINYSMPWLEPRTDTLRADISYIEENNDSYESRRWESAFAGNRQLDSGWTQSISTALTSERSVLAGEVDHAIHLVPAISFSKISADNPIYPSRGYRLAASLAVSQEGLISDSSFVQLRGSVKLIRHLPWQLRLLTRADLGFTLAESIDDLPASRRFFTGGDSSIRGYDYQSLGPVQEGKVIGGRHLATGSLELERPIYGKWSLAAFIDGGNAWDEGEINPVLGVGLGVRWRSPIGPLRVDLGVPLDKEESGFRIHFSLGPEL